MSTLPSPLEAELECYAYSYPHKSSYRPLSPPVPIADAWRDDDVSRLSLYVHIPFCEMRCGFCNLFTQSQPAEEVVSGYLATLSRQMRVVLSQVLRADFAQFAMGGGTPTFLTAPQLESLLSSVETALGRPLRTLPTSVETSPATATPERLQVLADHGIHRISLGVQSFLPGETGQIGRPQRLDDVYRALDLIRGLGFPVLNIDLIYGEPRQTVASWLASLREALRYRPEELYLYPLYVRPETGLASAGNYASRLRANQPSARRPRASQLRDDLYTAARDLLGEHGYVQASLRCFRLPASAVSSHACQRDGMIGLGCGARSYTRRLHYATRFAVTQAGVRTILKEWLTQTDEELAMATHGIRLSEDEQRRRFVILGLLQAEGLSISEFQQRFPLAAIEQHAAEPNAIEQISGFLEIVDRGWAARIGDRYILTSDGLQYSDVVGPLLYSEPVLERLRAFSRLPEVTLESTRA